MKRHQRCHTFVHGQDQMKEKDINIAIVFYWGPT
jgi:hypothetical protein